MPASEVFMKLRLLEAVPEDGSRRRVIIDFIESLGARPHPSGDYVEPDDTGRECQVKIVGGHAVVYWPDHAVKTVMVIGVQKADCGHSP